MQLKEVIKLPKREAPGSYTPPKGWTMWEAPSEILLWDKEGKVVEGNYSGLRTGLYDSNLLDMRVEGQVLTFSVPTQLQNLIDLAQLKIGQKIAIQYLGETETKGGRPFKLFHLFSESHGQGRPHGKDEDLPF